MYFTEDRQSYGLGITLVGVNDDSIVIFRLIIPLKYAYSGLRLG